MEQFLQRCFYHSGQYASEVDFSELDKKLKKQEVHDFKNLLKDYYLLSLLVTKQAACLIGGENTKPVVLLINSS